MRRLSAALLLLLATVADARLIATPSHQELLDKSDLVVIAVATASRDTAERADLPGMTVTMPENKTRGFAVVGLVRERDGRYAPTCGQADPGLLCIHALR
jgi:hypothetical protein